MDLVGGDWGEQSHAPGDPDGVGGFFVPTEDAAAAMYIMICVMQRD